VPAKTTALRQAATDVSTSGRRLARRLVIAVDIQTTR